MAAGIPYLEFEGNHSCKCARMRVRDFLFFFYKAVKQVKANIEHIEE